MNNGAPNAILALQAAARYYRSENIDADTADLLDEKATELETLYLQWRASQEG